MELLRAFCECFPVPLWLLFIDFSWLALKIFLHFLIFALKTGGKEGLFNRVFISFLCKNIVEFLSSGTVLNSTVPFLNYLQNLNKRKLNNMAHYALVLYVALAIFLFKNVRLVVLLCWLHYLHNFCYLFNDIMIIKVIENKIVLYTVIDLTSRTRGSEWGMLKVSSIKHFILYNFSNSTS